MASVRSFTHPVSPWRRSVSRATFGFLGADSPARHWGGGLNPNPVLKRKLTSTGMGGVQGRLAGAGPAAPDSWEQRIRLPPN